jgi:hypothetical protein
VAGKGLAGSGVIRGYEWPASCQGGGARGVVVRIDPCPSRHEVTTSKSNPFLRSSPTMSWGIPLSSEVAHFSDKTCKDQIFPICFALRAPKSILTADYELIIEYS